MDDKDKIIKAYECGLNQLPGDRCENCPYGYGYLDESGDNSSWWCNDDKLMKDMYTFIKQNLCISSSDMV